tara:strand:- start:777 stop:1055 length:279 start_codon:yes stop_codon:yes gene_type:complete
MGTQYDPYLRLASAVIANSFIEYQHAQIRITEDNWRNEKDKKRTHASIGEIEASLLDPTNPYINYLEAHGHELSQKKIYNRMKQFRESAIVA